MTNYFLILRNTIGFFRHSLQQSKKTTPNLAGDRQLEWGYVAAHIGHYVTAKSKVLDFGCDIGLLSSVAASLDASVLAIDILPQSFQVNHPSLTFQQTDILDMTEDQQFDVIINCSTIEHVGLSGRYNSPEDKDGDLHAMQKMHRLLKTGGHMLLTLPIGQDNVFKPFHRVYGKQRLPQLLKGYSTVSACYWKKDSSNIWVLCPQEEAFSQVGNDCYYAIGCMILTKTQ